MPIARVQSNTSIYSIHTDVRGAVEKLMNLAGVVVWSAVYVPFGSATVNADPDGDGSTVTMPLRLPGQYYDQKTGLHYNYHRYYDPMTGRYITPDPIGLAGEINLYSYVQNNPVNWIDPEGLLSEALTPYVAPFVPYIAAADGLLPFGDVLAGAALGLAILHDTMPDDVPAFLNENSGQGDQCKVKDALKGKKGSIKNAPLPKGSPSWDDIQDMSLKDILKNAQQNKTGFKTINKLLKDKRFDK